MAFGSGLNDSRATVCFCSSSDACLAALAGRLENFGHRAADRPGFFQMREQQRQRDGGRMRDGLDRAFRFEFRPVSTIGARSRASAQMLQSPRSDRRPRARLGVADLFVSFFAGRFRTSQNDHARGRQIGRFERASSPTARLAERVRYGVAAFKG